MWESDFKWYGEYPDLFPSVYSKKSGLFSILQNHCKKAKYTTQKTCNKATLYVNNWQLTPSSSYDIKRKKINLMQKNFWKCVFRASRRLSFSYFPKDALDNCGCPSIPFGIFMDQIKKFNSSPMHYLRWSSLW